MENASKALIIAGAILVSLIIIALGVLIVNRMSSTVNKANLNSEEAQAHNSKFDCYFGDKVTATETRNLLKAIASNNVTADTKDESKHINIAFTSRHTVETGYTSNPKSGSPFWDSPSLLLKNIFDGYTYKINVINDNAGDNANGIEGYWKSGFYKTISISENAKG